ncbi:MAG: ATP-binding cassette domain-containing protein [Gemmatimonadales bacterium]|nr:ATP-binding cassette domain-containing protein [Gemmatimonadales bacterium]
MIAVQSVHKYFGAIHAVDDVSFRIDPGEVVGFLGANGAGKTTMMRMLTGMLQPDAGAVSFEGRSIGEDLIAAKRRIGFLPESNPLYVDMLVHEFLTYAATLRDLQGTAARSALADAVEQTAIQDVYHRPISELSKGYRQRVGLAAAVLHRPDVLVLDEPTEGLDPNQRLEIRKLIGDVGRDRTVLLSTHVLQEVEATCTRLLVIHRGRLVADGGVADLLAAGRGRASYVLEAEGVDPAQLVGSLSGLVDHSIDTVEGRVRLRLVTDQSDDLRPILSRAVVSQGGVVWELYRERATVEQLFQTLTSEGDSLLGTPGGERS